MICCKKVRPFFESQICAQLSYLKMKTQSMSNESKEMGKAYRQFSRMRYKELKESLKNVRESQIVLMIIREWDTMPSSLKNKFMLGNTNDFLSTPAKMEEDVVKMNLKNKSNLKTTTRKMKEEENQINVNNQHSSDDNEGKDTPALEESVSKMNKSKTIKKSTSMNSKRKDYISFYKFHYKRIMETHSNWTATQASVIIKLMWKQERSITTKAKANKNMLREPRRMTGRAFYSRAMKNKGVQMTSIKGKWKRLPQESKKMWQRLGNHQMTDKNNGQKNWKMNLPQSKTGVVMLNKLMKKQ